MIQDAHSRKVTIPVSAGPAGDTVVVASVPETWLYIHELQGDLDVTGTLSVLAGSRILGTWTLDAGQGLTTEDIPGEDNRPRFECKPGEDFILRLSAGATFEGAMVYSLRY